MRRGYARSMGDGKLEECREERMRGREGDAHGKQKEAKSKSEESIY